MHGYPVWAQVDLDAIAHNCAEARRLIGPDGVILMVVKADGYGLGAIAVAHEAARHSVERFGVATLDEGVELRESGIDAPILMFTPSLVEEVESIVRYEIEPTVADLAVARAYGAACKSAGVVGRYQVEVDTGMGRWGVWGDDAISFFRSLAEVPSVELAGVYTHFPATRGDQIPFSQGQVESFDKLIGALRTEGFDPGLLHGANSATLCWDVPGSGYHAVRPGIFLYGFLEPDQVPDGVSLRPALSLRSRVVQVRPFRGGENVSYGLTYQVPRATCIATIPVGYGHGYSRGMSNGGEVLIRGHRAPIVGQITMDALMVDCGEIPDVAAGDEVVLLGVQGEEEITVAEVALRIGCIPYEVTCAIGRRVPRVYTRSRRELWARTMLGSRRLDDDGRE